MSFEGVVELGERGLKRAIAIDLSEWEESGFRRSFVDDAAFQLELHYRSNGFAFAEVEYEAQEGRADVVFRVTEGPRVRVRSVVVRGAGVPGGIGEKQVAQDELRMAQ